jgi:outer membrane murein-binding lipoprotein Lpp
MKLRKLFTLFAAFAMTLGLAGCSSNKQSSSQPSQYTTYMNAGIERVKDGDYDTAADKFEQAYDQKKTAKAKAYENQADDFADAQEDIQDYEFKDAKEALTDVINEDSGYHLMTSRATRLRRKIQTVIDNFQEDINPLRKQAKQEMADKQYSQAADTLQRILDLPYINGKYYKRVRRQVKNMLTEAQDAAKQNSNNTNSNNNTSSSTNTKSYADGSNAANTSATDTTVGGQAVSMSGRGQIRSRLIDLGFDQSQFTDDQIIGIFRTAYANGHQSPADITAADVHQYLGR